MNILTQRGYDELTEQLAKLNAEKKRLSVAIGTARLHGDLSENADYHAAKEQMGLVLNRISTIEERLAGAQIMAQPLDDKVRLGTRVVLRDLDDQEETEMLVASSAEMNFPGSKVSIESALGKAILGKAKGDTVEYLTPRNVTVRLLVVDIISA